MSEITPEMIEAGSKVVMEFAYRTLWNPPDVAKSIYRAMQDAAPQPDPIITLKPSYAPFSDLTEIIAPPEILALAESWPNDILEPFIDPCDVA